MTRMPYATLVATIMCLAGVGVFCGTMYRGVEFTRRMFEDVFYFRVEWLDSVQLAFVIIGACMGAVGLMILFVGFLTTGETRRSVYKAWTARVGGRISCAVVRICISLIILFTLCEDTITNFSIFTLASFKYFSNSIFSFYSLW